MEKLVITVAVTGSVTTKEQSQYLPVTPEDVAEEAYRSYNAGASLVHLHARHPNPKVTDVEALGETIQRIKAKCNMITQVGTGARDRFGEIRDSPPRLALLDIRPKPDMETINAGTFTFQVLGRSTPAGSHGKSWNFLNPPELIEAFARGMKERKMGIEFEIYDTGHIGNVMQLVERGVLDKNEKLHFDFVMGIGGAISPVPKSLLFLVDMLPGNCTWNVLGVGIHEFPMVTMGMIMGGNIRVGLEDNIYLSKGVLAKSNAELVEKAVRIAKDLGREIATADEARKILELPI
jgi:3-keto-5-aminohexanoate cleavage enzyme